MLFIHAVKKKAIKSELVFDACMDCSSTNSLELTVYQRYFRVYWIPVFPLGKTGSCKCLACGEVHEIKELPQSLQYTFESLKSQSKTSPYYFIGSAFFLLLLILTVVSIQEEKEEFENYYKVAKVNDVIELRDEDYMITWYKVAHKKEDTLFIQKSSLKAKKVLKSLSMKKSLDTSFSKQLYPLAKQEFLQWNRDGKIMEIKSE